MSGPIRDLSPLAKLTQLTHLTVSSHELQDLTPLAALPELRYLRIVSEQPQDWFVLSDMPHLHEVEAEECEANTRELVTFQEVLTPWDVEFRAETPRPLQPVRLIVKDDKPVDGLDESVGISPSAWDGNEAMQWSELRWHARRFTAALERVMGDVRWGSVLQPTTGYPHTYIRVGSLAGALRLPDIVEAIRPLLAESRFVRSVHIVVDTEDPDFAFDDEEEDDETRAEREREDEEYWQQKRQEYERFLERQHRLRLQQQEGGKINPEEFAPEEEPPPTADEEAENKFEPEFEEGSRFFVYAWITEIGLCVAKNSRSDAERLMIQSAE